MTFRCDATADELIDVIEGNRIYVPCLYVLNKIDAITIEVPNPMWHARANARARAHANVHEQLDKIGGIPIEARATFHFACAKGRARCNVLRCTPVQLSVLQHSTTCLIATQHTTGA